jgi:hypothetical protein
MRQNLVAQTLRVNAVPRHPAPRYSLVHLCRYPCPQFCGHELLLVHPVCRGSMRPAAAGEKSKLTKSHSCTMSLFCSLFSVDRESVVAVLCAVITASRLALLQSSLFDAY